jgi:hypothetical protein
MSEIEEMDIEIPDLDDSKPRWKFPRDYENRETPEVEITSTGYYKPGEGKEPFQVLLAICGPDKLIFSLLGQKKLLRDLVETYGPQPKDWKGKKIKLTATGRDWRLVK